MRSQEYDDDVLQAFLSCQDQLFDEPVAETVSEAEAFLSDCMAVVCDSEKEVYEYFEDEGTDLEGAELDDICEVFRIPDGRYLIVEG
ncbi:MAG: glyoxalase [Lachnospiraceae bacterium]|nr:glyoxalase [Lachnospiraceae bacterium]